MDVNVLPALRLRESDPSGIKLFLLVPELRNGKPEFEPKSLWLPTLNWKNTIIFQSQVQSNL